MQRRNILAHRGMWADPTEKNSLAALRAALSAGYGIETDFRDWDGRLCISHDPVPKGGTVEAAAFLSDCADLKATGRLALNIKADGLQAMLSTALADAGIDLEQVYAFDMSVPDALGYLKRGFPAYTRISEYETVPSFPERAAGVWVDNFSGDFPQIDVAREQMAQGRRVAIVSPELHGRSPEALWDAIAAARLHQNPLFELCTDFPDRAYRILGTD